MELKKLMKPVFPFPISPSKWTSRSSSSSHSKVMAGKKKSDSGSLSNKGSEPPRIKSNVKQSLQLLKLWKESQKKTPKPATAYRRKKVEKEELPEDIENFKNPERTLYYTNNTIIETGVPVLLVDGYNVCGYWPKLKKHFMSGQLDIARHKLVEELSSFSEVREVKVVVVFDAKMSGYPTHKESYGSIDIVFAAETSADTWIETEVAALREDGCPKVWVATSDRFHQQGAYFAVRILLVSLYAYILFRSQLLVQLQGAFVWSSKTLVTEIKASKKELEEIEKQKSTSMQGKLLMHNLDPEVLVALKDLRSKLSRNQ